MKLENQEWSPSEALFLLRTKVAHHQTVLTPKIKKESLHYSQTGTSAAVKRMGMSEFYTQLISTAFINRGIDPLETTFSKALNTARLSGMDIRYEKGNGERLPYSNASFDAVFCMDVLDQVTDANKFIAEIARVLKPGGILFFDTANAITLPKPLEIKVWQQQKNNDSLFQCKHVWGIFIKPEQTKSNSKKFLFSFSPNLSRMNALVLKYKVLDFIKTTKVNYALHLAYLICNYFTRVEAEQSYRSYAISSK